MNEALRLKYYMFDWDDNILHMPTKIHLERRTEGGWEPYDVSTAEFARIRRDTEHYRPLNGDWERAFSDFYDVGERGDNIFLEHTAAALKPIVEGREKGAPSFYRFKKALIKGRLFAIVTARAHGSRAIRRAVEYFIDTVITPEERIEMVGNIRRYSDLFGEDVSAVPDAELLSRYLDLNRYRGVSSPEFQVLIGREAGGSESPEYGKQMAVREFVLHIIQLIRSRGVEASISMGFSDDDPRNIETIEDYLEEELAKEFPDVKFVVYDTSDPKNPEGRKVVIRGK